MIYYCRDLLGVQMYEINPKTENGRESLAYQGDAKKAKMSCEPFVSNIDPILHTE